MQTGASDCGLFAIVTATHALCHRIPPSNVVWDQATMQSHLCECFEKGKMTPFPGRKATKPSETINQEQEISVISIKVDQINM